MMGRRVTHAKKFLLIGGCFAAVAAVLFFAMPALAETPFSIEDIGSRIGLGSADLRQTLYNIIRWVLGILALVAVAFIIYGGFLWLTSRGDEKRIEKAKRVITSAVIGLIIVLLSWAIVSFVFRVLTNDILGGGGPPGGVIPPLPGAFEVSDFETARPLGIPADQQVYLCSSVQSRVNNTIDVNSVTVVANLTLKVFKLGDATETPIAGQWAAGDRGIVFDPDANFDPDTWFVTRIPKTIKDTDGNPLVDCHSPSGGTCADAGNHYRWEFKTGFETDSFAPTMTDTYPIHDGQPGYPDRNVSRQPILEVTFSEPVDMTSIIDLANNPHPLNGVIEIQKLNGFPGGIPVGPPIDRMIIDVSMTGNGFRFSLTPLEAFEPFTWYKVTIANVTDLCGNPMDPQPFAWQFRTNDLIAGVQSQYPTGNTACPDTRVRIVFNTTMFENVVTFNISGAGDPMLRSGPSVQGSAVWPAGPFWQNGVNGRVEIVDTSNENQFTVFDFVPNPGAEFLPNKTYTVQVTTDRLIAEGVTLAHTWNFAVATAATCSCAPFVSHILPDQGPRGQCITVGGLCFTGTAAHPAVPTAVDFTVDNNPPNANQPKAGTYNVPAGAFGPSHIVATVPNGVPQFANDDYLDVAVTIDYADPSFGTATTTPPVQNEFFVNSNDISNGPCLFDLAPDNGIVNTPVHATGIRFGAQGPGSKVLFNATQAPVTPPNNWNDTDIGLSVPNVVPANYSVTVQRDGGGTSNPLPFTVDPIPPDIPIVISQEPNCDAACVNAQMRASFNRAMDAATFTPNSVKLFNCPDAACTALGAQINIPPGNISYSDPPPLLAFTPPGPLLPDRWYRVQLMNTITDTVGTPLGGLNFPQALPVSYSWVFKTKNDPNLCELASVDVQPDPFTMVVTQTQDYVASAFGSPSSCNASGQALNPLLYNWGWSIVPPPGPAVVTNRDVLPPGPPPGDGMVDPVQTVTANAVTTPTTNVQVTANGKTDSANLTIVVNPLPPCNNPGDCLELPGQACVGSQCVNHVCTPLIKDFNPTDGPEGTWVTVNGCWFGAYGPQSKVQFHAFAPPGSLIDGILPAQCGPPGSTWSNSSIVIEVPNRTIPGPDVVDGTIWVQRDDGMRDESTGSYDVNLNPIAPGLCSINPTAGSVATPVTLRGRDFGAAQGAGRVEFNGVAATNYPLWNNTQAQALVPGAATDGLVKLFQGGQPSNGILFDVTPASCNACVLDADCAAGQGCGNDHCCYARPTVIGRFPAPGAMNVCRNTVVSATFDQQMDPASFTSTNVTVANLPNPPIAGTLAPGGNAVTFSPSALLNKSRLYTVIVRGGVGGVASQYGITLAGNVQWTFTTNNSDNPCAVDHLACIPSSNTFTHVSPYYACGASTYTAQAQDATGAPLAGIPGVYNWTHGWVSDQPAVASVNNNNLPFVCEEPGQGNLLFLSRGTANLTATITGIPNPPDNPGWTGTKSCTAQVNVDLCDNPWLALPLVPDGTFEDAGGNCTLAPLVPCNDFNFSFRYCRGNAGETLLPNLDRYIIKPETGDILKEFIFKENNVNEDDAIGVRILANPSLLSPSQWYLEHFPGSQGAPQTMVVDGYEAVRDGRTVYVAATNVVGGTIYTDIYLISHNQDAKPETIDIFNRLLSSWQFNTNFPGPDKGKITRDLIRLQRLSDFAKILETYQNSHGGVYPTLEAGSFIRGISTSVWPSWQATLGNALGATLPTDPMNQIVNCTLPDTIACWDEQQQRFDCPVGSRIFAYHAPNENSYDLYANLEYQGPAVWAPGAIGDFNPQMNFCAPSGCGCFTYRRSS